MDNLFFYSSKIIWLLISPYNLFVILLTITFLLLLFNRYAKAKLLLSFITLFTLMLSFFSLGDLLLYPLESRFQHNPELPEKVDGIIVLGGSVIPSLSQEWQQLETNSFNERIFSFIELAHRYPQAKLVFTGGSASLDRNRPTEADIIGDYLLKVGIQQERLILENQARNTVENVTRTQQLLQPAVDENWVVITTAFHMPRSIGIFCQQGWSVIPYPVDHHTLPSERYKIKFNLADHANNLQIAVHEWLGLAAYYATAKIGSILPRGCSPSEA
jgi:uncharacterized SAM-binding protein YcdF (DUF218 family)